MKPYSKEFRGQVLAACDKGRSTRSLQRTLTWASPGFGVSSKRRASRTQQDRAASEAAACAALGGIRGSNQRRHQAQAGSDPRGTEEETWDGPVGSDVVHRVAAASAAPQKKSSLPRKGNVRTLRRDGNSCVGNSRFWPACLTATGKPRRSWRPFAPRA